MIGVFSLHAVNHSSLGLWCVLSTVWLRICEIMSCDWYLTNLLFGMPVNQQRPGPQLERLLVRTLPVLRLVSPRAPLLGHHPRHRALSVGERRGRRRRRGRGLPQVGERQGPQVDTSRRVSLVVLDGVATWARNGPREEPGVSTRVFHVEPAQRRGRGADDQPIFPGETEVPAQVRAQGGQQRTGQKSPQPPPSSVLVVQEAPPLFRQRHQARREISRQSQVFFEAVEDEADFEVWERSVRSRCCWVPTTGQCTNRVPGTSGTHLSNQETTLNASEFAPHGM